MATITLKIEGASGDIKDYYNQDTLSPSNTSEHKISINNGDSYVTVPLTFPTTVETIFLLAPANGITTLRITSAGPVNADIPVKAGEWNKIALDSTFAATISSLSIANTYTADKQIVDIRVYSA